MSPVAAIALGIFVNCVWGLAFLVPHVLREVDPVLITLGRYLCYGALSAILVVALRNLDLGSLTRRDWIVACGLALTGNVGYYALVVVAIQLGGIPIAALVIGTLPITIAVVGNLVQREFPFRVLAPAIVLIGSGLVLLNGHKLLNALDGTEAARIVLGIVAATAALALWTWYGIVNARFMKARACVGANAWSIAIGLATGALSLIAIVVLAFAHDVLPIVDASALADRDLLLRFLIGSLVLGVVVSWFATTLWNRVARSLPVSLAGQLVVFETLAALSYAFVVDWRWPTAIEVTSAGLIIVGVVLGIRATMRAPATGLQPT